MIKVDTEYCITLSQEIEEVDTDEHYTPKISIGILDVTLEQKIWRLSTISWALWALTFAYNLFWCSGQIYCTGMTNLEKFIWGASIKFLSLDVVSAIAFLVMNSETGIMQSLILASFCYFIWFFFLLFYLIWFLRRKGGGFVYACKIGYITFSFLF